MERHVYLCTVDSVIKHYKNPQLRKQQHIFKTEKVEEYEIELGLPFMVPDLV
jgi:hypothetical protein